MAFFSLVCVWVCATQTGMQVCTLNSEDLVCLTAVRGWLCPCTEARLRISAFDREPACALGAVYLIPAEGPVPL